MPGESPSPRHRISLVCPECGHSQLEPAMVMSTHCRACGGHFKVVDGKALKRASQTARLAKPVSETDPEPPPPAPAPAPRPPKRPPRKPWWQPLLRLLMPPKPPRQVRCFDCAHTFTVAAAAQSSQCPRCSCYISLTDYEIDGPWNREIHTRGDVTILKAGSVTASSLQAHNLTIIGELRCPADCSGDVTVMGHGRSPAAPTFRVLPVLRGARVEFLQPVTAAQVVIDGQVRGRFHCAGTVLLRRRSHLHGYVRAAAVVIRSGAKHHGVFETAPPPAA